MKKFILILALMIGLIVTPLSAATLGTIVLGAIVVDEVAVTCTTTNYTFANAGATEVDVGSFTIVSNAKVGYTFTLTSANGFALTTSDVTSTWAYTLGLYSDTTKLTALNAPYGYSFNGRTPKGGMVYKLKISYLPSDSAGVGGEWLEAGNYSDVITFTIAA